jgi:hypothetical protein
MTPPWFVVHLPQRNEALRAMAAFARRQGLPAGAVVQRYTPLPQPDGRMGGEVQLRVETPDGVYGIGYKWLPHDVERWVPRAVQPNHTCPAARWPADITCPPRALRRLEA